MTPLILNQVESVAEGEDDIAFGTASGPTFLDEPEASAFCADSTMVRVDGPPEPMMMPVRSLEISCSSRPASRIAWSIATWFQAVPPPWKRIARRSTISGRIERRRAGDMAAEAVRGVVLGERNAALGLVKARQHFLGVVADGGDDPHPRHDDPLHCNLSLSLEREPLGCDLPAPIGPGLPLNRRQAAHRPGRGRPGGPWPDRWSRHPP